MTTAVTHEAVADNSNNSLPSPHIRIYGKEYAWKLPLTPMEIQQYLGHMLVSAFAAHPDHPAFDVELLLVRDGSMGQFNQESMHCTGPTNILSFPITEKTEERTLPASCPGMPRPVASLVLSVDAVQRESSLFRQDPARHLLRLLAHGIGHLMGYQHGPKMFNFCNNLLN